MALVLVPAIVFLLSYYAHISTLTQDLTDFSTFMSPYYKHTLENNPLNKIVPPGRVYYGSTITIRHKDSLGGYLHSHELNYQSGSHEQQVTLYDFPDNNNEWIVEHKKENKDVSSKAVAVKNGENIRLRHRLTGKLLRASGAKPPVSEQDYDREVSCTGDANYTGQSDELWKIRFSGRLLEGLVPLDTTFQLTNQGLSLIHIYAIPAFTNLKKLGLNLFGISKNQFKDLYRKCHGLYQSRRYVICRCVGGPSFGLHIFHMDH